MNLFNIRKHKKSGEIVAICTGNMYPIENVNDDVFSKKILGDGTAFEITGNQIVSPVDGVIDSIFPGGHAYNIVSDDNIPLMIHIGLDTVNLNGEGFDVKVTGKQRVKKGKILCIVDTEFLKSKNSDFPIMLVNLDQKRKITFYDLEKVEEGSTIIGCY